MTSHGHRWTLAIAAGVTAVVLAMAMPWHGTGTAVSDEEDCDVSAICWLTSPTTAIGTAQ